MGGPILRSRGMCADSGPMKLPYWVSGLISMTCRGHNNDPWFGDGRSATLDDCATDVSTFNNLHFTTSFYCMNQPDTGTLYSHSCETDAVILNAKFGKEYDFYCTNYGKGTYNQPGPILRNRGMCADSGPMKLPYWVSGLLSMTCRGHNNDPWFGDGRSATLDDCATAVSTFNNLHFVYAAAANNSRTSALSPAPTQAMQGGMNSSSEFLSKRGNVSMLNTTESLPAMLSASMAAMASVSPTSSPQSFYKFRVRNGFFTSNSAKAQAAVREAASAVGISVSWMDDTDTSVSGLTGFFLKVMINTAVDHDAFIFAFQTACRGEGLSYGISKWLSDVIEVASFYKFRVKNSFNPSCPIPRRPRLQCEQLPVRWVPVFRG